MIKKRLTLLVMPLLFIANACAEPVAMEPFAQKEAQNLAYHLEAEYRNNDFVEMFRSDTSERAQDIAVTALKSFPFRDLEFEPTRLSRLENAGFELPLYTLFNDHVTWCLFPNFALPDGIEMTTLDFGEITFKPILGDCNSPEVNSAVDATIQATHAQQELLFSTAFGELAGSAVQLAKQKLKGVEEMVLYAQTDSLVIDYPNPKNDLGFSTIEEKFYEPLPDTLEQMGPGYLRDSQSYACLQFRFFDRYIHLNNDLFYWDSTYIKDECGTLAY